MKRVRRRRIKSFSQFITPIILLTSSADPAPSRDLSIPIAFRPADSVPNEVYEYVHAEFQQRGFASEAHGYTATRHQREVGTGGGAIYEGGLTPLQFDRSQS